VAAAVVVLVAAVALVLSGGEDEPGRVATLPAPTAQTSSQAQPEAPEGTGTPREEPSRKASATADPDTPTSNEDEPTPAPDAPQPGRSAKPTAAPAPAPTASAAPAPKPTRTATAAPAPTATASGAARRPFAFDAAYGTDEPYEVVVQYGDSSSCPHARVTHAVRESAEQVVVTLEADAQDQERACTTDYRQMLVPVRLKQPLGDRVLIDGSRDQQVEVDRSCNRPFDNPPPPKDCTP
jgi:outer membrane biosynthesis protein TonB